MANVDFAERVRRVMEQLGQDGVADALVVTDPSNVRWLTGLSSSNAAAVVASNGAMTLVTDGRYAAQASATGAPVEVLIERRVLAAAVKAAAVGGDQRVAVEADSLSMTEFATVAHLVSQISGEVIETIGLIESLRPEKDAVEVAALQSACEISVQSLAVLITEVRSGMTEIAVARRLEQLFGRFGAEDRAFPSIVAAGPNSAVPHHEASDRVIGDGDILKIDFGARFDGYHADCTRTFIVGGEATAQQLEIHAAVADAADSARAALRVGVEVAELYEIARNVLENYGYADRFTHGLGHGVGLQIHEAPLIGVGSAGTICDGSVVTIEPGVYLPDDFGVRIEDTCLVTTDGMTILTDFPRELARIG